MQDYFEILYEDSGFLIVNKRAAIPVLPDKSGDRSLKEYLMELRPGGFLEAAHRLDRRTSGVVAFCKTRQSLAQLSKAFQERQTRKLYWALVETPPPTPNGSLRHLLVHNTRTNLTKALPEDSANGGRLAVLTWETLARGDSLTLLAIVPLTGRTHQIRAQLSAAGMPIRGDLKYGARRSTENGLLLLHARELSFEVSEGKKGRRKIQVVAEPPADETLWRSLESGLQD